MFGRLAGWILSHRRLTWALLLLALAVAGVGLSRLRVDFSFTGLMGSRDPAFAHLERFVADWGPDDGLLLVVVRAEEGDLLEPERLERLERLLSRLEALEATGRVGGLPRAPRDKSRVPGLLDLAPLVDGARAHAGDGAAFAAWRAEVLSDPLLVPAILSADARVAALFVELRVNTDDLLAVLPALTEVRRALDEESESLAGSGLTFLTAGIPAVRADLVAAMMSDQLLFALASFALMTLLLAALFRCRHGVLVPLAAACAPTLLLLGVMGFVEEPIGLLSQVYPTLLPVIAIADAIHVVTRFHQEARVCADASGRLSPEARDRAIVAAISHVGTACLFTSLTTAVGFASLALADMLVLRSFGLYAALGVVLAYGSTLVVVPLALGAVRRVPPSRPASARVDGWLAGLARLTVARRWLITVAALAVGVAAAAAAARVEVDNHLSDNLADGHATKLANHLVDEQLAGVITLWVDLRGAPGTLLEPRVLAACLELERWARSHPPFRAAEGPGTLLAEMNRLVVGVEEAPATRELAAQLLVLSEGSGPLDTVISADRSRGRIALHLPDLGDRAFQRHAAEVQALIDDAFNDTLKDIKVSARLTGVPYVAFRGFSRLAEELLVSLLGAFAFIAAFIALLFRSLRVCAVSIVPNVLPLLFCLAAQALLGWHLNPTSTVVYSVALGLAVDDTLHLLARVFEERRRGRRGLAALEPSLTGTGRALVTTSLILGVGFGINALSSFPVSRVFGALGALAIVSALVMDLLVLPALLYVVAGEELGVRDPDDGAKEPPSDATPR